MMMFQKVEQNKQDKRRRLEEAAYELFQNCDFDKVSIDAIVKKANIAKGTFYLYYRDKVQLINQVIVKKTVGVVKEALCDASDMQFRDKIDEFLYIADELIEHYRNNIPALRIIKKNISWNLISDALMKDEDGSTLMKEFSYYLESLGHTKEDSSALLFLVMEMISTAAYSSLVMKQPKPIDELKPLLYSSIRNMLETASIKKGRC